MKNTIGIIDLGSNTFHLLIARITSEGFEIIYKERSYVFLAQNGINTIAQEAFDRGQQTLESFYQSCRDHNTLDIIAVGTAALRSASNGLLFLEMAKNRFGIEIELIDGNREAQLIYKGIVAACPDYSSDALMMDIGGGSTEFTITKNNSVVFQESLPIGLGVIRNSLPLSDPATSEEIQIVKNFIELKSGKLIENLNGVRPKNLIGGSGTFDVIAEATIGPDFQNQDCGTATLEQVNNYISPIISSTEAERIQNSSIPQKRVNLAVYAFIMIEWILEQIEFEKIVFSKFALKEGLLQECFENWKRTKQK
ncbi:Ppx/GppA phosphatase family protein [Membranihabitans maritimus]|uniref:Ppx/GppA phosphatase family protein n=1 Tax=Membranihabitans maritimus TaxID=2904244 RepID=UPI001F41F416|nr:hypothetical protein [Membranihabitans maritimus]